VGKHDPLLAMLEEEDGRLPQLVPEGADSAEPDHEGFRLGVVARPLAHARTPARLQLSKHFNLSEFHCRDGTRVPAVALPALRRLCSGVLEPMRATFGTCRINSGYRHAAYNRRIGGARFSEHIYEITPWAVAADVRFARGNPAQWAALAWRLGKGGVGRYDRAGFVHVDNGPRRSWRG
jgi:hypothetical protein